MLKHNYGVENKDLSDLPYIRAKIRSITILVILTIKDSDECTAN